MKKAEIVKGGVYSNEKTGRFYSERKVIDIGNDYTLYSSQEDCDCVKYETVNGQSRGNGCMTRARFANWAKKRIS